MSLKGIKRAHHDYYHFVNIIRVTSEQPINLLRIHLKQEKRTFMNNKRCVAEEINKFSHKNKIKPAYLQFMETKCRHLGKCFRGMCLTDTRGTPKMKNKKKLN